MNGNLLFKKKIDTKSDDYWKYSLNHRDKAVKFMRKYPEMPLGTVVQRLQIHPEYLRTWLKEQE